MRLMMRRLACRSGFKSTYFSTFTVTVLLYSLITHATSNAEAQTWQPLNNGTPFQASTALLLTDGTVLCQEISSNRWFKLTPDQFGNYVTGTWSAVASMDPGYGPLYYASAVLADGRVVV